MKNKHMLTHPLKILSFSALTIIVAIILFAVVHMTNEPTILHKSENPYTIIFAGDSITYGLDPEFSSKNPLLKKISSDQIKTPFPYRVGQLLSVNTINYGVPSASLMDGLYSNNKQTPMCLLNEYQNYENADLFVFMIGINDLFRSCNQEYGYQYALGTISDSTSDTFYGSLHLLINGLINKYGKEKLLMLMYPEYPENKNVDGKSIEKYFTALTEVAECYGIPVLDLRKELGITVYTDTNHEYWLTYENCHPTQKCADLIAETVAKYIKANYM